MWTVSGRASQQVSEWQDIKWELRGPHGVSGRKYKVKRDGMRLDHMEGSETDFILSFLFSSVPLFFFFIYLSIYLSNYEHKHKQ